jgi:lipoate-protein ligase A
LIFSLIQKSLPDPYFQLAWEEAIALRMKELGFFAGIRIWQNRDCLVLGISEKESQTIREESLSQFQKYWRDHSGSSARIFPRPTKAQKKEENFPPFWIARRASGGGTVFQTRMENLNFSLFLDYEIFPELYPVKKSYEFILGMVISVFQNMGYTVNQRGSSDLTLDSEDGSLPKKISGNAQFRKKSILVQHGTLILSPELIPKIASHQLHPPDEPEYRKQRTHFEFLTSLPQAFSQENFSTRLKEELTRQVAVWTHRSPDSFSPEPGKEWELIKKTIRLADTLRSEKYATWDWVFRESKSN